MKATIFFVLLIVFIIFFISVKLGSGKGNVVPKANDLEVESRIQWLQSNISSFYFSTDNDLSGDMKSAHLLYRAYYSFTTPKSDKVKSLEVSLVDFKIGTGTPLFIHPSNQTVSETNQSFIFTNDEEITESEIVGNPKPILYNIVSDINDVTHYNDVHQYGGIINFAVISKHIGKSFSYKSIMARDSVYDTGKILEYSGVSGSDLNTSLSFDITITFTDGKVYKKRFSATVDGETVLKESSVTVEMK